MDKDTQERASRVMHADPRSILDVAFVLRRESINDVIVAAVLETARRDPAATPAGALASMVVALCARQRESARQAVEREASRGLPADIHVDWGLVDALAEAAKAIDVGECEKMLGWCQAHRERLRAGVCQTGESARRLREAVEAWEGRRS